MTAANSTTMDIPFYSLELPDGVVLLQGGAIDTVLMRACLEKKARLYKLINPLPAYKEYSYAVCDNDDECILFKEFPSNELRPRLDPTIHKLAYESVHRTIDPVEADLFWKENQSSEEREIRILQGLAAIQEACRAIDYSEQILASSEYSAPPPSANAAANVQTKPQTRISLLMIADSIASNATCPITTNPLTHETAVCVAPCYHIFEREAITKWLESKDTCPTCRESCSL